MFSKNLETLTEQFIEQGRYLRSWSPKTIRTYRQGLNAFQVALGESAESTAREPKLSLTKAHLGAFVVFLRERGMSPGGCNCYIRSVNSFLTWLHTEEHLAERLRVKLLRNPRQSIQPFSDVEISRLLARKPKGLMDLRAWTFVVTLLDTGCRIDELLTLERANVDFDNLLLTVRGKGNKTRKVPISEECRKHLWTFCNKWDSGKGKQRLAFSTESGLPLAYRNAYRDFRACFAAAGVKGPHVHPHTTRHTFSCHYIRNGGDVYRLSRLLGHTNLATTSLYLRGLGVEDMYRSQERLTPLSARP